MPNFRLVFDVSAEDDPEVQKIRYAWYETKEAAIMQAEHEMATPTAIQRHRAHFNTPDLELHPSGIKILGIEDKDGKWVWKPRRARAKKGDK